MLCVRIIEYMRLRLKDALAMGCVWWMRVRLELFEGLVKDYGVCVWTYAFALWRYAFIEDALELCV